MTLTLLKELLLIRKRTFLLLGVLFVAALVLQLFVSFYQKPKVDRLQSEWMKLREQEGRGIAMLDRESLYRNGQLDLKKFRERIYPKAQFARFIGDLYEMAAKNRLELISITYKPSGEKDAPLLSYLLTLTVSGSYPQLKRFIFDMGAGRSNVLVIDSISMAAAPTTGDTVQLQLSITSWFARGGK